MTIEIEQKWYVVADRKDEMGNWRYEDWLGPYSPRVAKEVASDLRGRVVRAPVREIEIDSVEE